MYFLCSLNKTIPLSLVSPITMFTKLIIQACQLTKCHTVMTLHLPCLQLQYQNISDNSKACLIQRTEKKIGKLSMTWLGMLQCIDTWRPRMFAIMPMQRFLKFWSVSSDQHIRIIFGIPSGVGRVISVNQNLPTVSFLTNRFLIAILLLTYVRNSEKEYNLVSRIRR